MIISEKILSYRKRQGLSQEELAQELDVSRQTISNWETGTTTPPAAKLVELSKQLGVSVAELLGEEPAAEAPSEESPKADEVHKAKKRPLGVWVLAACAFVVAVLTCIGVYILNLKVDNLTPVDTAAPMEELEGEEVDISSIVEPGTRQPLQP